MAALITAFRKEKGPHFFEARARSYVLVNAVLPAARQHAAAARCASNTTCRGEGTAAKAQGCDDGSDFQNDLLHVNLSKGNEITREQTQRQPCPEDANVSRRGSQVDGVPDRTAHATPRTHAEHRHVAPEAPSMTTRSHHSSPPKSWPHSMVTDPRSTSRQAQPTSSTLATQVPAARSALRREDEPRTRAKSMPLIELALAIEGQHITPLDTEPS